MDKFKVYFTAENQQLTATGTKHASDTYADIEATFTLGAKWADMDSVSAVWWNDFTRIATVLDSDGKCLVPHEVLERKGCVRVNLVGSIVENGELVVRLTSYSAEAVHVNEKIKLTGTETAEVTPSQFEQFVANVKSDANRAEDARDLAKTYADQAGASASDADISVSNALSYANNAYGYAQTADGAKRATEQMTAQAYQYMNDAKQAKTDAETARDDAETSANNASASAESANIYQSWASDYANNAQSYANDANNSKWSASVSASDAKASADKAESAVQELKDIEATATTLPSGSSATASYDDGLLSLGIPKGDTGATPQLSVGTVETLEPTEDATVTITGTAKNPVLNFGLPKGEQGDVNLNQLYALYPTDTASGDVAIFTDGADDIPLKSLKIKLEPMQDGTPWMDTNVYTEPYKFKASPQLSKEYNAEDNAIVGGTVAWNQLVSSGATSVTVPSGHKYYSYINGVKTIGASTGTAIAINDSSADNIHDLTQMFGTTIADYIYSLEQANEGSGVAWFKKLFPNDYYPYDSGTLKSVEGLSAHVMKDANGNVIGNYPLDNSLTLRGIPKLDNGNLYYDGDEYASDGSVTRRYGVVDLGTLNWVYVEVYGFFRAISPSDSIAPSSVRGGRKGVCSKYPVVTGNGSPIYNALPDKTLAYNDSAFSSTKYTLLKDSSYTDATAFKTAMSGVYLVYELATPTTETATAYTNPQSVEPYGTEEYVTTSIVPVGHKTRYMRIAPISGYTEVDTFVSPTTSETDATKYTTQLGQTVYGGTLDVVSGELVVDKGYIASYNGETLPSTWISDRDVYASGTTPSIGAEVVYELATLQIIQLTPTEVRSLLGTNNVWSDGDVDVVYRADIGLYIDKKLS